GLDLKGVRLASSSALRRRNINTAAFAAALALHLGLLVLVAGIQPAVMDLPMADREIPDAPYEIFLAPRLNSGAAEGQAAASLGYGQGAGLRGAQPAAQPTSPPLL